MNPTQVEQPTFRTAYAIAEKADMREDTVALKECLGITAQLHPSEQHKIMDYLVSMAMVRNWNQGLQVMFETPEIRIPHNAFSRGFHYYLSPRKEGSREELLALLDGHQDKLTPNIKATLSVELGAYLPEDQWTKHRASGLLSTLDSTQPNFRMHGGAKAPHPERLAQLLAEMPVETKARVYSDYFSPRKGEPMNSQVFHVEFMKELIKDDVLFEAVHGGKMLFKVGHDHLTDPDYVSGLLKRHMLNAAECLTGFLKNPQRTDIADMVIENLKDWSPQVYHDKDAFHRLRTRNAEGIDLINTLLLKDQPSPIIVENANRVNGRLSLNIKLLRRKLGSEPGPGM